LLVERLPLTRKQELVDDQEAHPAFGTIRKNPGTGGAAAGALSIELRASTIPTEAFLRSRSGRSSVSGRRLRAPNASGRWRLLAVRKTHVSG
jgi:hypothetical protein